MREILAFCQTQAISPGTHEENHQHEERMWQMIKERFCHNSEAEVQDLVAKYYDEISEAMYTSY